VNAARPWYRGQTGSWYVQLDGKQHPLGKHPAHLPPPKKEGGEWKPLKEIAAAWHRLMAGEGLSKPMRQPPANCRGCGMRDGCGQRNE
jgi:hypothetical protein